ncbi:MAG: uridine kinase [Candidatus Glassbacteria bacterium]|nr:uridine kinase [Candidatus Glassbacteria bacterium]
MPAHKRGFSRTHISSRFMRESLLDKGVIASTDSRKQVAVLPDQNVIMVGGKSIIDRGRKAVYPLIEEIVENKGKHGMILSVSGGIRVRHSYAVGLDFGLPPGGLSMLVAGIEEQNARILYALLAKHGGIRMTRDHFEELSMYIHAGMIPIMVPMPPHMYWEKPPKFGNIPDYGPDFGIYMVSEVLGTKSMIYIKDQDGLFTEDPRKNPDAELIKKISVQKLLEMDLNELIIERSVLEVMVRSRLSKKIYIINGLKHGNLTKALNGRQVGTVIFKDESRASVSVPAVPGGSGKGAKKKTAPVKAGKKKIAAKE